MARYGKAFEWRLKRPHAMARAMRVVGHRGAAGRVAENTVASLRAARTLGADGVEFDVRRLADRLIVLHDATVDRTTDGHGNYQDFTFAALRRLRTAADEPIPLLEEALAVVAGFDPVNVEVKAPGIADAVIDALEAFYRHEPAARGRILLSSFDPTTTARLAARRGAMRLGLLYEGETCEDALARGVALGAHSLHLPHADLNPARVVTAHAAGLRVGVYTVNEPEAIATCAAWGVDYLFTDYPDRARDVLAERAPP